MTATGDEPEVRFERRGRLGLITLNRPRAINALTHGMVREIHRQLDAWRDDDAVATIAITGAGERGLCAGGDIVGLYRDATEGDGSEAAAFWADEYRLNAAIARFPKPYVAIQDGIVLGGGIGVSAHGSHRVVTERSSLGLPETGIGFVPDVGATWLLSRAPHRLGLRLAMSAASVGAADAILVGLADRFVPSERILDLLRALETQDADAAIAAVQAPAGDPALAAEAAWTERVFASGSVPEVLDALEREETPEAAAVRERIAAKSPIAVAVALEAIRRAEALASLEEALEWEYRVSCHAARTHDFIEGVRAQVIDKDRNPRWQPAGHDDVTHEQVEAYFALRPEAPLGLADI